MGNTETPMPKKNLSQIASENLSEKKLTTVAIHTKVIGADIKLRVIFTCVMLGLFILTNGAVIWLTVYFAVQDKLLIQEIMEKGIEYKDFLTAKVITPETLMALIGATAVQVGVSIVAMVNYLFPKNYKE